MSDPKAIVAGDSVVFSTGRKVYANNGIVGLCPSDMEHVYEGYDGCIEWPDMDGGPGDHDAPLTRTEKLELASMMVEAWERYRNKAMEP